MIRVFKVKQGGTDATLWVGHADDEAGALDAMAREAGYADFAALPREVVGPDTRAVMLSPVMPSP